MTDLVINCNLYVPLHEINFDYFGEANYSELLDRITEALSGLGIDYDIQNVEWD